MRKEGKVKLAEKVAESVKDAKVVFGVNYEGLNVKQLESIRNDLKLSGDSFHVVKNNVFIKAIEGSKWETAKAVIKGPLAYSASFNEPTDLAKFFVAKSKEFEKLMIQFCILDNGQLLDAKSVEMLSKLPSKNILLAQLLFTMNAPMSSFVNVLAAKIRSLLYVLNAIGDRKKES